MSPYVNEINGLLSQFCSFSHVTIMSAKWNLGSMIFRSVWLRVQRCRRIVAVVIGLAGGVELAPRDRAGLEVLVHDDASLS